MPRWALVIALASGTLIVPACNGSAEISQAGAEEPRVRAVLDKYLESIDTADVALASDVWARSPTVEAVTPIGRFKGWDSVRDGVYVNRASVHPGNDALRRPRVLCVG